MWCQPIDIVICIANPPAIKYNIINLLFSYLLMSSVMELLVCIEQGRSKRNRGYQYHVRGLLLDAEITKCTYHFRLLNNCNILLCKEISSYNLHIHVYVIERERQR